MPEILTESFCERCGTRYTFEAVKPRVGRFGRVRTLSRGVSNYVLRDGTSFGEALADARSDIDRRVSIEQLDAFHKTFNFCMQCRQYTCGNCWNEAEGLCITCAPRPDQVGRDIVVELDLVSRSARDMPLNGNGHTGPNGAGNDAVASAAGVTPDWPSMDLEPADEHPAINLPAAPTAARNASSQAILDSPAAPRTEPHDLAATTAAQTASLLARFRAFRTEDDAEVAATAPMAPEPEPIVAELIAPEPMAPELIASEPMAPELIASEPMALEPMALEPEPIVAEPEATVAGQAAETVPAGPPAERATTPVWQVVAPEVPLPAHAPAPGAAPIVSPSPSPIPSNGRAKEAGVPAAPAEPAWPPAQPVSEMPRGASTPGPQWPASPSWPAPLPRVPHIRGADVVWAQSNRDLLNRPETGVQACVSCGLPLSATARFCRRCGTNQVSA
jgi:ribosomal protein L40E